MKILHTLILVVILFNTACAASDDRAHEDNPPAAAEQTNRQTGEQTSDSDSAAAVEPIVTGNTQLAFDLYTHLKDTKGNLFFSPYSISTALAMVYAGAEGRTQRQMAQTLHFDRAGDSFHTQYGSLIDRLNEQGRKGDYQLLVADALWLQQDYDFLQDFLDTVSAHYEAALRQVDFVNAAEAARQTINEWTAEKTQGKIQYLIPQGALDTLTRLVLTNAIYFKGNWAAQFDKAQTKELPFYVTSDKTVTVPLMFQKEKFRYAQTDTLQLLELPYAGGDLSMLVLLPVEKDGLNELEKQLTAKNLTAWQKQMQKKEVRVFLPRFTMTSRFGLKPVLSQMGMPVVFSDRADFSGITDIRELAITDVIHKAYVQVNEEGTEAAAATGIVVGITAVPAQPPVFRADHPFVFLIKDNATGSILFIGRVMNPIK